MYQLQRHASGPAEILNKYHNNRLCYLCVFIIMRMIEKRRIEKGFSKTSKQL